MLKPPATNLKTIATIYLLITLWACGKDSPVKDASKDLYAPSLNSVRNDGKIILRWEKPFCEFNCPELKPERFEVLMSDTDPSRLSFHSTVSNSTFETTVNNLANGVHYYFAIRAVGSSKRFAVSNTVMTIPNKPEHSQPLFQTVNTDRELGTWSPDQSSVAFVGNYIFNSGNNMAQSVFISTPSNNNEWLVEINARSPEWSPNRQKLVYHTENGEVNTSQGYRPAHIAVYNIQDSTAKRLTSGNSFNWLPSWSPDGNWIAFLSDRAGGKEYNIWKVPSDGGSAIQVTADFGDLSERGITDDRSPKTLSWSKDGNNMAFARPKKSNKGYDYDLYAVPATGGSRTTILSSQWNDFCPAYSPDGKTIAFVSDRSGINEIWTMNLQTKKLVQVTGSTGKGVHENAGKIEWSSSGNKILFTSYTDRFSTLYTVDIN